MLLFPELETTKPAATIELRHGTVIIGHTGKAFTVRGGGSDESGTAVIDCDDEHQRPHRFSATTLARCIRQGTMRISSTPAKPKPMPTKTKPPTPAEQRAKVRAEHPGVVLMFRMGDFYELFDTDAVMASKQLGLTLTRRIADGIETPMAGFPYHQLDGYLAKLKKNGHRVALCEQAAR